MRRQIEERADQGRKTTEQTDGTRGSGLSSDGNIMAKEGKQRSKAMNIHGHPAGRAAMDSWQIEDRLKTLGHTNVTRTDIQGV